MKSGFILAWILSCLCATGCGPQPGPACLWGAFLADRPTGEAIERSAADHGKSPAIVLIFVGWGQFPDEASVRDIYAAGSIPLVTWEPWYADEKRGIDVDEVTSGRDDDYIREFARRLKKGGGPVLLRFAHEMNGDWYPWSAHTIGAERYRRLFIHVWEVFDQVPGEKVRWIFSINAENVPAQNTYEPCYPGDSFVDYIGLDGYNWGSVRPWSRWKSFQEIFSPVYHEVVKCFRKPVMITEFSSTSQGGDKAVWIEGALGTVRHMPQLKAVVLFDHDKETDWCFRPGTPEGVSLRAALAKGRFRGGL